MWSYGWGGGGVEQRPFDQRNKHMMKNETKYRFKSGGGGGVGVGAATLRKATKIQEKMVCSCQELRVMTSLRLRGAKIQEQLVPANPRSHANFQIFYSISCFWKGFWQPFLDLINSKDCTHEYKLLNFSDLKEVDKTFFKNAIYQSEKKHIFLAKSFWSQCHIYVLYMY